MPYSLRPSNGRTLIGLQLVSCIGIKFTRLFVTSLTQSSLVLLVLVGCALYPMGLANQEVRDVCGAQTMPYELGKWRRSGNLERASLNGFSSRYLSGILVCLPPGHWSLLAVALHSLWSHIGAQVKPLSQVVRQSRHTRSSLSNISLWNLHNLSDQFGAIYSFTHICPTMNPHNEANNIVFQNIDKYSLTIIYMDNSFVYVQQEA